MRLNIISSLESFYTTARLCVFLMRLDSMNKTRKLISSITLSLLVVFTVAPEFAYAKQVRSQEAKNNFKATHPCPANGKTYGSCPGYVIDHITALACKGADDPSNMQWQSVAEGKAKDKWERKGCSTSGTVSQTSSVDSSRHSSGNGYFTGPRGGCFTYSASGRKRYVDHSKCSN